MVVGHVRKADLARLAAVVVDRPHNSHHDVAHSEKNMAHTVDAEFAFLEHQNWLAHR